MRGYLGVNCRLTPTCRQVHSSRPGGKLMKHTICVLLLAMAVLTPAQTKKNGPLQGIDTTTQALINLENTWADEV
jgi:hypothetical protein